MKKLFIGLMLLIASFSAYSATSECYTDQAYYGSKVCRLAPGLDVWVVDKPKLYWGTSQPGDQALYGGKSGGGYTMIGYKVYSHSLTWCNWNINKWKLGSGPAFTNDPVLWNNVIQTAYYANSNGFDWAWYQGSFAATGWSCANQ